MIETLPTKVQRALELDLQGYSSGTILHYTKYGFMPFLRFTVDQHLPLNMESLREWSRFLQQKGNSTAQYVSAFGGFRALLTAHNINVSADEYKLYNIRFKQHARAYGARETKRWRYPISEADVINLMGKPPKKCSVFDWNCFVALAWVFLLRKGEILRVKPSDLKEIVGPEETKGFKLRIQRNKNSVNKKEARFVFFPLEHIPKKLLATLRRITRQNQRLFKSLPSTKIITKHLRRLIHVDTDLYELVIHSFRHGRPENLLNKHNYDDKKLMRAGRWESSGGARAYKHS
ncbi:MAG: hypothetical protein DHS20C13_30110 [Thermodesulfobacteriota bacterium]|nr:MAG: hypothetical protein DHS20C13_30110 [Thermodesulfobacteriota bacterium]